MSALINVYEDSESKLLQEVDKAFSEVEKAKTEKDIAKTENDIAIALDEQQENVTVCRDVSNWGRGWLKGNCKCEIYTEAHVTLGKNIDSEDEVIEILRKSDKKIFFYCASGFTANFHKRLYSIDPNCNCSCFRKLNETIKKKQNSYRIKKQKNSYRSIECGTVFIKH